MLVLETLGAPERRGLIARRKRAKDAPPLPDPEPVQTTRATLVQAEPFPNDEAAERWRKDADAEGEVDRAVAVLNEVLHAHRAAAADPHVREVTARQAIAVRVGIGEGEQVAHGRWQEAISLPRDAPRAAERRESVLRPQERLAAILSGRDVALACEELILRGRADLDAGRTREAALQLRIGLEAAIVELSPWRDRPEVAKRLGKLSEERGVVGDAANAALEGGLDRDTELEVERVLKLVEAALRARTLSELGS